MADRLSDLPDEILLHILSLLPTTKHRVSTSVLSRRWRHLWTHVPSLEFHPDEYPDDPDYPFRVSLCLDLLTTPTLHRLSAFMLPEHYTPRRRACNLVDTWISAAASKSIHELSLHFHNHQKGFRLPTSLLSCSSSLRVLKLQSCDLTHIQFGPSSAFNSLATLVLRKVLTNEEQLQSLLRVCPILVDLHLHVRHLDYLNLSSNVNPKLKNLRIEYCFAHVVIDLPDLQYLSLAGDLPTCTDMIMTQKLREVDFSLETHRRDMPEFPLVLLQVRNLSASAIFFMEQKKKDYTLSTLKVLHGNKIPYYSSFNDFTSFLKHCPSLEIVYITLYYRHDLKVFNELRITSACNCPIKSITIMEFTGIRRDMLLLRYLLGVMTNLKHLRIVLGEKAYLGAEECILGEVYGFPRASPYRVVVEILVNFSIPSIGRCFDFN